MLQVLQSAYNIADQLAESALGELGTCIQAHACSNTLYFVGLHTCTHCVYTVRELIEHSRFPHLMLISPP